MTTDNVYITTPIYYVNAMPHIGHAYTTIVADVLARHFARKGPTFFSTGSDENSLKNVEAAKRAGTPVQQYVDEMALHWSAAWDSLGLEPTEFIRTSSEQHRKGVHHFWREVVARGDIYKGTYQGHYCQGCEAYINQSELPEDRTCPLHKTKLTELEQENYFFRASKYRDAVLLHIEQNPDFIVPESRRNEVVNYLKHHFDDISVSRPATEWGIPVPDDPSQVIYVWFDALVNYLTVIGYGTDTEKFRQWWPADIHLIGKDIIKFHCALWPAMLLSANLPLPRQIVAHGFFTVDGEKISKSLGNAINPIALMAKYGNDALRYYMLTRLPFGSDGNFSLEGLQEAYNADLANGLGNLASRVSNMVARYISGQLLGEINMMRYIEFLGEVRARTNRLDFKGALDYIWSLVRECNKRIEDTKPWVLAKQEGAHNKLAALLTELSCDILAIGEALEPYMPNTSHKIAVSFNFDRIKKMEPLFPRLGD